MPNFSTNRGLSSGFLSLWTIMFVFTATSPLHCFFIVITVDLSVSMMIHWWCNSFFVFNRSRCFMSSFVFYSSLINMKAVVDRLFFSFTCNYVVTVRRAFLFLLVFGIDCVIYCDTPCAFHTIIQGQKRNAIYKN